MKRILLVVLLGFALSGCATPSAMYNRVKGCVYPQEKPPIVVEAPTVTPPPAPPIAEPTIKVPEPTETKEEVIPPKKKVRHLKAVKKRKITEPKKKEENLPPPIKEKQKLNEDLQKVPTPTR
jgi:hypothetical protein